MNCLTGQIETLRKKLLETVDSYSGNFLHPHVISISQELDLLIVHLQRSKYQEYRLTRPGAAEKRTEGLCCTPCCSGGSIYL